MIASSSLNAACSPLLAVVRQSTMRFTLPAQWPAQGDLVAWCQHIAPALAAVLILLGVIYLLFGFNLFKMLMVLNAAAVGMVLGLMAGNQLGAPIPGAVAGAIVAGAIAWPMMKWAVAIMGGVYGAVIGATLWRVFALDSGYTWSGALSGAVGFGLLCFIHFRGCVMMYTSFQGAMMLTCGILGLMLKYPDLTPRIGTYLAQRPFLLPMCVFIPTVIGMMYQQNFTATGPKPAPAGGAPKK